jgi:hypothetical protein
LDAATYADGLHFGDADLASKKFSFQVAFDDTDMWWGQNTQGAPNTLPELTFWFGGFFDDDSWSDVDSDYYIYEGNMVLTGTVVPEPGTLILSGLGLAALALRRRRR